jgi:hypothetical protein
MTVASVEGVAGRLLAIDLGLQVGLAGHVEDAEVADTVHLLRVLLNFAGETLAETEKLPPLQCAPGPQNDVRLCTFLNIQLSDFSA